MPQDHLYKLKPRQPRIGESQALRKTVRPSFSYLRRGRGAGPIAWSLDGTLTRHPAALGYLLVA
jgi:hypothetical protein